MVIPSFSLLGISYTPNLQVQRAMVFIKPLLLVLIVITAGNCSSTRTPATTTSMGIADKKVARNGRELNSTLQKVNATCPTWTFPNATNSCECGSSVEGIVKCDQDCLKSSVLGCYCVTYDIH